MIVGIIVAISFGTLVELVPLMFIEETNEPIAGLKPLPALELEGRDIYIREGCNTCHSQMIRPLRAETERYGHYSVAGRYRFCRYQVTRPGATMACSVKNINVHHSLG